MNTSCAPIIRQGLLQNIVDVTSPVRVGSAQWFAWLDTHSSFRFESPAGSFSARKEVRSGKPYWYAYRKTQGKRISTYIGKAEEMTWARLITVVGKLLRLEDYSDHSDQADHVDPEDPTELSDTEEPSTHRLVDMLVAKAEPAASRYIALDAGSIARLNPPAPVPLPTTRLVDRVDEVASLVALLRRPDVRVVSLVGPGGIGKTRLAFEAISALQADFRDGVYFLSIDSVRDPQIALTRVARLFGLPTDGHTSIRVLLSEALQHRELLLILDNLEQVPEVVPMLDELVSACDGLKLLVTSREVLYLRGEHSILVKSLSFPDPADLPPHDNLLNYPAIALFLDRATAIAPNLDVSGPSLKAIAQICARLDGLPLAIELAAARVRLLSPEALLERLEHLLAVLTGGGRERPARHQTLRATLDWSYDLLHPDEQSALRRLAVFNARFDLDAAEAVCNAFGELATSVLDILSSLIDKSLLLSAAKAGKAPRLSLSETVREYALERLERSGELRMARTAHAEHYISLARQAGPGLHSEQQMHWLGRFDRDEHNFNAALSFLLSEHDYDRSAELVGDLGQFWYVRGRLSEGLSWAEQVLYAPEGEVTGPRNRQTLLAAGLLALHLDQGERAQDWLRESFELSKAAGDNRNIARASHILSLFHLVKGNVAAAKAQAEELFGLMDGRADPWTLAHIEYSSGMLAQYCGEFARSRIHLERCAALFAELGDLHLRRMSLLNLADALLATGERARAQALFDEQIQEMELRRWGGTAGYFLCAHGRFALSSGDWSRASVLIERALDLFDRLQDIRGIARASLLMAQAALYRQDYLTSITMARRCIASAQAIGAHAAIISCLEELADAAMRCGRVGWAVQLWAAGERQRQASDPHHHPAPSAERAQLVASARQEMGELEFLSTWEEGHNLPIEQLLSLENVARSTHKHRVKAPERPAGLTKRELDVLLLVAKGLSNLDIAEQLVISPSTVVSYLNVIYGKLDVSSRTAAMRYAIEHRLVTIEAI